MDECERSYCPNIRTIVTPRTHFLQAVRKGRAVVYGLIQARSDGHWEPGSRCRDSPKLGLGLCCLSKPVGPSLIAWPSLHGPCGSRRVSAIVAWSAILVTCPWGWIPGTISSNSPPPPPKTSLGAGVRIMAILKIRLPTSGFRGFLPVDSSLYNHCV